VPQKLEFSHAKLLVISEDIAQSGLVGEYIAPLIRSVKSRNTGCSVSQGSAQEFIERIEPFLGEVPLPQLRI
jgi:spore germination protein KC